MQTTSNNGSISSSTCLIYILCQTLHEYFIAAVQLLEEKLDLASGSGTGTGMDYLESPVSDGTIEENFEEALVDAPVIESGV